jgi:hypothetical protein
VYPNRGFGGVVALKGMMFIDILILAIAIVVVAALVLDGEGYDG